MNKALAFVLLWSLAVLGCAEVVPMTPEAIPMDPEEKLDLNATNGLFDVVVVVDRSVFPTVSDEDVTETFTRVAELMEARLGVTMRLQEIVEIPELGDGKGLFHEALSALAELPEGVILFAYGSDDQAELYGGYSKSKGRGEDYCNEFASPTDGQSAIYVAVVDWDHRFGACGYDASGKLVRRTSADGECFNTPDTPCVWNGEYSICENALHHPYAVPGEFRVASIVHEFLHPFGTNGSLDHYGTAACVAMMNGEPLPEPPEDYFNMCPPVLETFAESYVGCP